MKVVEFDPLVMSMNAGVGVIKQVYEVGYFWKHRIVLFQTASRLTVLCFLTQDKEKIKKVMFWEREL